jgi:2-dehydro-3-deoxygluconokinase
VVGEAMAEFVRSGDGWVTGCAGDAFNIAAHLARFGHDVAFASALGLDPFSETVRAGCAAETIDARSIITDPHRNVGLYAVQTDADGERTFTYWRSDSAARQMFALPESSRLVEAIHACDVLVFSLITLAVLPAAGRAALLACAAAVRARGGLVVFDGNYRARLWPDVASACAARDAAIAACDIGLPTLDDEMLLGARDVTDVAGAWSKPDVELVVKLGAAGCRLPDGRIVAPATTLVPVDTSGAGDAFDAGYLNARLAGCPPHVAAAAGHRLAGWVIMHPGACPARDPEQYARPDESPAS